ncbi:MAG: hypothetical protein KGL39_52890 [Patescibacteria group bacterium]|nr:hypothetical protein [Patescibacteria group bacterium]
MDEQSHRITFKDICITVCYVIAVGLNAYIIMDQVTNGQSSQDLSLWLTRTKGKLRHAVDLEQRFQKEKPYVMWEAINTVEGTEP